MTISEIFGEIEGRYRPGVISSPRTYYFSLGEHRYTLRLSPEGCQCDTGKTVEAADVVLKTTPKIFLALVLQGKRPGTLDIARGRFKTNSVNGLTDLQKFFDFS